MLPKGLAHCLSTVLLPVLLVAGCKGAGARAAAVAGSGSQPFQGLYLQTQWAGTAMQYVHYYFWHDGRICQVRPTGGLDREPADFAALQKQAIAEGHACGTYALHGKSMTVAMNGAAPYEASIINVQGDSFEMNQYATSKVPSYGSGKMIDGTYTGTIVGHNISKESYTFHSDGTFQYSSTPVMGGIPRAETGKYKFSGNTLQLETRKLTAYPFPDGGINIEGTVYSK